MSFIELIIFDLDGTLADSLADLTDATNHMLGRFNKPLLTDAEVRNLVGKGARNLVERALQTTVAREVDKGLEMFLAFNSLHIADKTTLYPGVPETLQELAGQERKMAVISNKDVALCHQLLTSLGIDDYFAAVLGADSLPFRKPAPEPILKLLQDFVVPAERSIIVGDSINDISAGKSALVGTVACTYGYGSSQELVDADYRIDCLPELLEIPPIKKIA